ncbi:hypothetical protein GGF42_006135, partial [Coemansia sp. RSA 2424]
MSPLVLVTGGGGALGKRSKEAAEAAEAAAAVASAGTGEEAARILEDRRRRNASASARFRRRRNERERELVGRCLFLEHRLAEALGARAFDEVMKRAPVSAAALEGARRPVSLVASDDDDS